MKEKALRETQIRSIHEMGEQERMNYLNDSGECHEAESKLSWKMFTRSQLTSKDSKSAIYAELRRKHAT